MSALVRTEIGPFHLIDAIKPDALRRDNIASLLLPPQCALADLQQVAITPRDCEELRHGRPIAGNAAGKSADEAAAITPDGQLVAILNWKNNAWWPCRVFQH
jgi:tRNA pseudouridine55 synthase